jgi:hypothetical protein
MKILVENILKNRGVICQIWVDYFTKPIDIIEYRTHNESGGGLSLVIGYQDSLPDCFTAFMAVWFKHLEFVEGGWQDQKLSHEDADLIIDRCLVPEASTWKVSELTSYQLHSECDSRIQNIKERITLCKRDNRYSFFSSGIYVNNVPVKNEQGFDPPVLLDTYRSGIILENEWNQVTYFVETSSGFVYYDWGTSA